MKNTTNTILFALIMITVNSDVSCYWAANIDSRQMVQTGTRCNTWEQLILHLSPIEREFLQSEGAIRSGEYLILAGSLISDCDLRAEMSAYFGRLLRGISKDDSDREFAKKHSIEIIAVLRRLWPSLSKSKALDDNRFHADEKYNLIGDPGLELSILSPLASDILDKEGINIDLTFIIFDRPALDVRKTLAALVEKEEMKGNVPEQIYGLALLQRMGDRTAIDRLRKLSKNRQLSNFEKDFIPKLLAKLANGKQLVFRDVEDLEYLNDRIR